MTSLFSNIYETQKQQLINVADSNSVNANFANITSRLNAINNNTIVNPVIESENARLDKKNEQIQTIKSSQDRTNALNESYRKRNWEYVKLLIVVAISLIIILGISMFLRNIIPDTFIDLFTAIIIGIVLIYAFMTYRTISSRSAIDFDKLNLGNPPVKTTMEDEKKAANQKVISAIESGDMLGATFSNTCSGSTCCDSGTKWCSYKNKCIIEANYAADCPEGFGTMTSCKSKDYSESEYTNYAPYM